MRSAAATARQWAAGVGPHLTAEQPVAAAALENGAAAAMERGMGVAEIGCVAKGSDSGSSTGGMAAASLPPGS